MTELTLRLDLGVSVVRIRAAGNLHAGNARFLSKVVIDCLRRCPVPALELDLTEILLIDPIGLRTILDCQRRAMERGVLFRLVGAPRGVRVILGRMGARTFLIQRPPPRQPQTGTVCRGGAS